MTDVIHWLLDSSDFTPRSNCGMGWTARLQSLHSSSDILIGLAYIAIPVTLLFFVRRRGTPFSGLIWLFGAFILACGAGHLIEATMFQTPVYRLSGVVKGITAAVSWVTVIALIPAAPRVARAIESLTGKELPEESAHRESPRERQKHYLVAVLAAVLAVLVRAALDPLLSSDHAFVLPLLAVVSVAWYGGLGPALACLLMSLVAVLYFFIEPRGTMTFARFSDEIAAGLFLFAGVGCAMLGESQRQSHKHAERVLKTVMLKQAELESEIARRERAEKEAEKREAEFRAMADNISQLAWMARPDGHIFWYNRRWYEYTGTTLTEMEGWGWEKVHDPVELKRMLITWRASLADGIPWEDTFPLRRHDGAMRWHLTRAVPVRDDAGDIVRWFGTNTDIDDFKRLREDLRASERRFRSLTEETPQLIWTTRPDRTCDYLSRQWTEYTGVPQDDLLGAGWLDLLHPDDRPGTVKCWENAVAGRAVYDLEFRIRRSDGAYRWFKTRGRPVRDDDGRITFWLGTCTDIEDVKRLQGELGHSLERFRLLTEAIPQVVWNAGADGEVTYFNTRWLEYTGVPVEDARGSGWMAAVHPDDAGRAYASWRATITAQADGFTQELRLRRASDGRYRWFLAVAVPLRRPDGAVDQWIGSMADIHDQKEQAVTLERMVAERTALLTAANGKLVEEIDERRKAESLVTATTAELTRSNGELEKFAYVASHDLQEPLRKIQAFGDRLSSRFGADLGEQGKDYLDRMQASAARMRQLINDLLAFSRVTTKTQPFVPVDLNRVAAEAVDDLHDRIEAGEAEVDVGPLPTVDADPTQMRQMVQNLIGNGLKFHKPDEAPRVTVRGEVVEVRSGETGQPRSVCRLSVSDNGIGFEEKYLDRIFQVFQRLHGRNEFEGTGVGLAICRKIVDRHGGEITARSAPGQGATFLVTLPVRQPSRGIS